MTKKLLIALGVSMMSALPMTQASPMTIDNEFNHFIPMEVKIDVSVGDSDNKGNKNNPPPMIKTDGKEDHSDKTNPPPKPPEKNGQAVNGNDNPPPPPSDRDGANKLDSKPDEKLKPQDGDSSVKKAEVKKKVKEDRESKTTKTTKKNK
ncbi:MAG: hypothetical protein IJ862_04210 [Selenomonadaceae bacterium]|nr:hypothetical protein [Selenomonadaceae bacterium]